MLDPLFESLALLNKKTAVTEHITFGLSALALLSLTWLTSCIHKL